MTDKPAAFDATFSTFKPIVSRGVVQIMFEVPAEKFADALRILGGAPKPGEGVWCAIARMKPPTPNEREHKSFHEMKPGQQLGILCKEKRFHRFIEDELASDEWRPIKDEKDAVDYIRHFFNVESRADIDPDDKRLPLLISEYRRWEHAVEFSE